MHLALVIKISEVYIFSELRDMVMNKVIVCLAVVDCEASLSVSGWTIEHCLG